MARTTHHQLQGTRTMKQLLVNANTTAFRTTQQFCALQNTHNHLISLMVIAHILLLRKSFSLQQKTVVPQWKEHYCIVFFVRGLTSEPLRASTAQNCPQFHNLFLSTFNFRFTLLNTISLFSLLSLLSVFPTDVPIPLNYIQGSLPPIHFSNSAHCRIRITILSS